MAPVAFPTSERGSISMAQESPPSQIVGIGPISAKLGPKTYLFYGPPGAGKTTAAAMHPGKRKLWLDMDDKIGELENLTQDQKSRIEVWRCDEPLGGDSITYQAVDPTRKNVYVHFDPKTKEPLGYRKLVAIVNELLALKHSGDFPFDAVVLDSLTRVSDHLVALTMWTHKVSQMTETLWGTVSNNLNMFLQGYLHLPCDRIVIGHDKHQVKRDRDGNILEETTRPMVVGQMANNLPQHFSEVYYFMGRSRDGQYKIQTVTDRVLPARTSKKLAPEDLVSKIFAA